MNDKSSKNDAFTFEKESKEKGFKSKKGYNKRRGKSARGGKLNYNSGKKFNDVSWYKKNPGITGAFVKLPFNYIIGNSMFNANATGFRVPVLLSYIVDWCANGGVTKDNSTFENKSILDMVATIIYTTMRRNNSGSTNGIEYVDPIISNLLASIDILANAVANRRVFKIANTFSWKNRLLPKILFSHLGIDYEDFISNQAAYRGRYNTLVAKARTIKTLSNFDFVNAICAQFENIFKDEDSDTGREQLYLPMKGFHHIYDPIGTTNHPGGMVRLMVGKDIGNTSETYGKGVILTANNSCSTSGVGDPASELPIVRKFSVDLDIMDKQIEALINDADFNLLQADIEKAFGEQSGYMVIDAIPDSIEPIVPIYSGENALMLKHGVFNDLNRATINLINYPIANTGKIRIIKENQVVNTVYQRHNDTTGEIALGFWHHYIADVNDGHYVPTTTISSAHELEVHPFLNLEENDPGEDSIILGTRYQNIYTDLTSQQWSSVPEDFRPAAESSDIMVGAVMSNFILYGGLITVLFNSSNGNVTVEHYNWSTVLISSQSTAINRLVARFALTNFQYHPSAVNFGDHTLPGELNNIRFLTTDELENIHRSCFLSLWDLPSKTNI